MPLLHLLVLAIVQGITEFLPISSSGHLILIPALTGWPDQGLLLDVAVHVGTLAAVLVYFWRDTRGLALAGLGALGLAPARRAVAGTAHARLFWLLVVATLPVVIVGLALETSGLLAQMRRADVIAVTSIGFGLLLYGADRWGARVRVMEDFRLKPALLIGLSQVLALIPGVSRSGITMTAARALGFRRVDAAHFSMLLAIPTTFAAGALGTVELMAAGSPAMILDAAIAAALAFLSALAAIHFLMKWLARADMTIFVLYRIALGFALFIWFV
ncbi:MAG: undecaprenyl-diphosphate phosphatase [Rhodothalassiaceae bacterium]